MSLLRSNRMGPFKSRNKNHSGNFTATPCTSSRTGSRDQFYLQNKVNHFNAIRDTAVDFC